MYIIQQCTVYIYIYICTYAKPESEIPDACPGHRHRAPANAVVLGVRSVAKLVNSAWSRPGGAQPRYVFRASGFFSLLPSKDEARIAGYGASGFRILGLRKRRG